ncbi:MAG: hypothetical protein NT076_01515, partial [Candidatus Pacearchaeota archaeon]|nr:hypothetical protein [Candidatus Pacearchaeota archaeon]
MKIEKIEIAGKRVMPVTNASGIVFNDPFTAARLACRIKELGMVTLKSTGLNERVMPTEALLESNPLGLEFGCREPTFVQLGDGTYVNAVKLINDGAEKTREKIERAGIPKDRIIISSVFAENEGKLEQIVRILAPVVDIIEWNGGCPHGERVGISQGQDPKVIYSFGKTIAAATNKPFIIKLPYDFTKECVLAAKESGAYGAAAINTVPCEPLGENGKHLLWNKRGGKSGKEIKDIGLQRVREIREVAGKDFFIIGMGGIYFSRGIKDYIENGANAVALGSVLTGMDDDGIARFIPTIVRDVEQGTSNAEKLLPRVNITRIPVRIRKIDGRDCDFKIYQTTTSLDALPGQFVFAGLYEEGDFRGEEKPFSIMDTDPLTIGVLSRGLFTKKFNSLREGDSFYVR